MAKKKKCKNNRTPKTKSKSNPNRRALIIPVSLVALAGGIYIGGLIIKPKPDISLEESSNNSLEQKISFHIAKKDKLKRQEYIEDLLRRIEIPSYIQDIMYCPEDLKKGIEGGAYINRTIAMKTGAEEIYTTDLGKKKIHPKIKIFPLSFRMVDTEEEFLFIFNHELNVSKIMWEGFDDIDMSIFKYTENNKIIFNKTLYQMVAELESYVKDLKFARKLNINQERINQAKENYLFYYLNLWASGNPSPKENISFLQRKFFQDWMKQQPIYYEDTQGAYLFNPRTNKECLLPSNN